MEKYLLSLRKKSLMLRCLFLSSCRSAWSLSSTRVALPVLLWLITCPLTCNAQGIEKGESKMTLKPEEFALLPWGQTVGDQNVFDEIRECGFNLAGFVSTPDLPKAEKAGLKAIVIDNAIHGHGDSASMSDDEITTRVDGLVKRVAGSSTVYGYYVRDEPAYPDFPALARWASAIRKAAPGAIPYINLFPNYVAAHALPNGSYEAYLDEFAKQVKPDFISYDHYALMEDGSLRNGYFSNLEAVRTAAHKHKLPFWNIVLSNAHFNYAEPSPAGLRFQAFTTLAYGARGLSYFTYFAPAVGNYRLAPVNQFGDKTPTWHMMREVNLQIHRLAPEYLKLRSVHVFHHLEVPDGCHGLDSSHHLADVTGGNYCVGEFETTEGNPAVLVVNKTLTHSKWLGLKFKKTGKIMMVNNYTGMLHDWAGENTVLAPGQGMLLILKPEAK